ncbi:hypothetical protein NX779_02285 [Mycoplasma cottewii]|uniref:Uncharacterized protein n=1 Tax=Mycoplasma cottewii TaxID=51364 RepID=A0ABY5TVC8_9MOLU|nr:hypothetical protein [Mycoplasma cottewii]UWD34624.1 hypothetical protein NX779_02285 [Mycoplasma cottewii]
MKIIFKDFINGNILDFLTPKLPPILNLIEVKLDSEQRIILVQSPQQPLRIGENVKLRKTGDNVDDDPIYEIIERTEGEEQESEICFHRELDKSTLSFENWDDNDKFGFIAEVVCKECDEGVWVRCKPTDIEIIEQVDEDNL